MMAPFQNSSEVFAAVAGASGCDPDELNGLRTLVQCLQGLDRGLKDDMLLGLHLLDRCTGNSGGMSFNFDGNGSPVAAAVTSPSVRIPFDQMVVGWEFNAFDGAGASVVDTAEITVETADFADPDNYTTLLVANLVASDSDSVSSLLHSIAGGRYVRARVTGAPATAEKLDLHLII
jgi:hypothetical protein